MSNRNHIKKANIGWDCDKKFKEKNADDENIVKLDVIVSIIQENKQVLHIAYVI